MPEYRFAITIPASEYLRYYQGSARQVLVHDTQGRRVQFPASALQKFVTREGISGHFVLVTDENHKLVEIRRA